MFLNYKFRFKIFHNSIFNFNLAIFLTAVFLSGGLFSGPLWSGEIARTIESIKPSIVGIGIFQRTNSPAVSFIGTGFVVGDGNTVITNAHVIKSMQENNDKEILGVMIGKGNATEFRAAVVVAIDNEHDIAQLKISGNALPVMKLGDSGAVLEGQSLAFTGFPLGMALGFHHVTHRGMISSITPVVMPALNSKKLDVKMIVQLQKSTYSVFQLDGTAYPGSSGSPLYDPETGIVYGVINMVFIKGMKESAISNPSGITYAIPGNFISDLLKRNLP